MNKFQIIIPPNVPYSNLLGSDKQFAIKLRKEIPIGPVSILTYVRQFFPDWSYNILDLNIVYSDMQQRKLFYDNPEGTLEKLLSTYINDTDGETIIGISALFNATFTYLELISKVCRKLRPNAFIFMGRLSEN